MMPNKNLVDYIETELNRGNGIDYIAEKLLATGWPEDQVELAFAYLFPTETEEPVPVPPPASDSQQEVGSADGSLPINQLLSRIPTLNLVVFALFFEVFTYLVSSAAAGFGMVSLIIGILAFFVVLATVDRLNADFKNTPKQNSLLRILLLFGTVIFAIDLVFRGVGLVIFIGSMF